ncbi:DUF6192 family protein [Streptomyces chattanoogensis]|uniref:RacO protein n=1 Tax=Streptomyces chattanoogensis TaxID=66876 RepID=A0A0N0GXS7_9ACTN|nr:DUF6192 family protein [Streptomyces chattanoogensis]KPC61311.1 hypothetical protein ADL29_24875 [Streptomyces chattanoogensis]
MGAIGIPEGFEKAEWDAYVRKGRKLIKQISDAKFSLGDTLNEMLVHRGRGHGEVTEIITAYARQIGSTFETLKHYRYVASAWPEEQRRSDVAWSVHRELAAHPDRFGLIRTQPPDPVTKEPTDWTYDQALRATERDPGYPVTREEKVERVSSILRDSDVAADAVGRLLQRPEVASRVVDDRCSRKAIKEATAERYRKLDDEVVAARELAAEPVDEDPGASAQPAVDFRQTPPAVLRILGLCTSFCVSMRDAIFDVQGENLAPEGKAAITESLEKVREICSWCEDSMTSGRAGMDEALARLLRTEGGEDS